jgi:hypothetical protein
MENKAGQEAVYPWVLVWTVMMDFLLSLNFNVISYLMYLRFRLLQPTYLSFNVDVSQNNL